jgi:hypothetical protein
MKTALPLGLRIDRVLSHERLAALALVIAVWAGAVVGGFGMLTDFDVQPAASRAAPQRWPAASGLPRPTGHGTLLMFVHPRCPCSRASLAELARIMEQRPASLATHVLFIKPAGVSENWLETSLWRTAVQVPGVEVSIDELGREAALFSADASGQTLLYDEDGALVFQGGITAGRGHFGANPASDRVLSLLQEETTQSIEMPVYGCPLQASPKRCCEPKS